MAAPNVEATPEYKQQLLEKLTELRKCLASDLTLIESVITERQKLAVGKGSESGPAAAAEITELKTKNEVLTAENHKLKLQVDRLEYRIMHLSATLDKFNAANGMTTFHNPVKLVAQ